ncbi:hypothetical protein F5880DRAFT_1486977 [Lentinula raphanica]|nr:hypothetical protein F5880DRAFT_1486977 [Lentinula raphanica]
MHVLPISLVLLAVAFYSIADVVTTRNSNKQPNYELSRHPSLNRRSHWSSSSNTGTSAGNDDTLDPLGDSELLDIVLVASVDGKFHALNRTSGHSLWSMPSLAPGQGSAPTKFEFGNLTSLYPSTLAPLVRTVHNQQNNEYTIDEDGLPLEDEIYIIEPQSGTIYILPSDPTSTQTPPLRRFPFTMPELVDMSPFSFSDPDGHSRLFVGRKETSMLVVELETGRVKASVGGECPWDPFDDMKEEEDGEEFELDLDELESEEADEKPVKTKIKPTEVYIGRTDYHISIHARPSRTSNGARLQTPPVQNLSFSTYGPNNQDTLLQSSYSRTKDDSYIQSLPSGELLAFRAHSSLGKTGETDSLLWFRTFSNPIVATFDVLKRPAPQSPLHNDPAFHTFVLLQPQPLLSDFHPSLSHANAPNSLLPNSDSAYVGIVEETGSLYAMSPKGFPFVAFGGADRKEARTHKMTLIDDAPGGVEDEGGLPVEVDEVTRRRKLREQREREQKELIERASSQALDTCDPLSNLLDAAPITISHGSNAGVIVPETQEALPSDDFQDLPSQFQPIFTFSISRKWEILVALCVGFIGLLGAVAGRYMPSSSSSSSIRHIVEVFPRNAMTPLNPSESSPMEEHLPLPTTPLVDTSLSEPPNASPSIPASNHSESSAEVSAVSPRQPEPQDCEDSEGEVDEAEGAENDATEAGGRKKKIRRKRGKKRKGGAALNSPATPAAPLLQNPLTPWPPAPNLALVTATPTPLTPAPLQPTSTLIVSETILGFGSHGTVVFRGSLQGRSVAVKRLLRDFVTLASREVSILQESDDHPNVIRYYYQETHANFLYIALELCPGSLADVYEEWQKIRESIMADPKKALKQITSGLKHLHALKLVHRDIKPQNILVAAGPGRAPSALSGSRSKNLRGPSYRMLISDFGLCKKLDLDQTSFLPTAQGAMGAGTFGWRAPEILRGEVKLDNSEDSNSSKGSSGTVNGNNASFNSSSSASGNKATRLTKSVDIFALGCLFYYMLSAGGHPFGDRFEREINIIKGFKDLTALGERYGEEGVDAADLIEKMLSSDSSLRPDTSSCLLHPFFWDSSRRLNFLQDASDRFENMCRDPRDAHLIELEKDALEIIGSDWHSRVDKVFIENLGKFRKYDGKSVQDLLRALRNKKHHYQDLPDNVKRHLGVMPEGYLSYFTRRYPQLFLHTHRVISESELRSEPMFKTYFELAE